MGSGLVAGPGRAAAARLAAGGAGLGVATRAAAQPGRAGFRRLAAAAAGVGGVRGRRRGGVRGHRRRGGGGWSAGGSAFRRAITHGLDPQRREVRVIRAMVLGERPRSDDELIDAFRNSGSLHVFAVSGLHVGLVGLCLWLLLRLLRVPRRWAVPLLVAAMFAYAWLAGLRAPAVRAAWMAALLLGGFLIRRPGRLLNLLSAVALGRAGMGRPPVVSRRVPAFLRGGGLDRAVRRAVRPAAGRLAGGRSLPAAGLWSRRHEWQSSGQRWLTGSLGVSLAAWCGSAPLVGWHFRLITPVAPLASLLLMPLVTVVLALALGGGGGGSALAAGGGANRTGSMRGSPASRWASPSGRPRCRDRTGGCPIAVAAAGRIGGVRPRLRRGGQPVRSRRGRLLAARLRRRVEFPADASCPGCGVAAGRWDRCCSATRTAVTSAGRCRCSMPSRPSGCCCRWHGPAVRRSGSLLELAPPGRWRSGGWAPGDDPCPCGEHAWWEVLRVAADDEWDALADDRCAVLRLHWHGWKVLFLSDTGFARRAAALLERSRRPGGRRAGARPAPDRPRVQRPVSGARSRPRVVVVSHDHFPPEERVDERMLEKLRMRPARGCSTRGSAAR